MPEEKLPLTPEQIETALTLQSSLIAGLFDQMIAQGLMTDQERRDLFGQASVELNVNGRLFLGPLAPLYPR